jgi:hypothetical protein
MDNHLQRSSLKKTILLKILMSMLKISVAEPVPPGARAVFMNYDSGPGSSLFFIKDWNKFDRKKVIVAEE